MLPPWGPPQPASNRAAAEAAANPQRCDERPLHIISFGGLTNSKASSGINSSAVEFPGADHNGGAIALAGFGFHVL